MLQRLFFSLDWNLVAQCCSLFIDWMGKLLGTTLKWIFRWAWTNVSDNLGNETIYVAAIVLSCFYEGGKKFCHVSIICVEKVVFNGDRDVSISEQPCPMMRYSPLAGLILAQCWNLFAQKRKKWDLLHHILFFFSSYEFIQCSSLIFIATSAGGDKVLIPYLFTWTRSKLYRAHLEVG